MNSQRKKEGSPPELRLADSDQHAQPAPGSFLEQATALAYTPKPTLTGKREEAADPGSPVPYVAAVTAFLVAALLGMVILQRGSDVPAAAVPSPLHGEASLVAGPGDLDSDSIKGARGSLYKVFVYAGAPAAGAVAVASVDGEEIAQIDLAQGGVVEIPLTPGLGKTVTLKMRGGERSELRARTSAGSEVSKSLASGDSVQWDVVLK